MLWKIIQSQKFIVIIACIILMGGQAVQVYVNNLLAIEGQTYHDIEIQIDQLKTENSNLQAQIARYSSLKTIYKEAYARGFRPAHTIYLRLR